jgi:hypothetical protein
MSGAIYGIVYDYHILFNTCNTTGSKVRVAQSLVFCFPPPLFDFLYFCHFTVCPGLLVFTVISSNFYFL